MTYRLVAMPLSLAALLQTLTGCKCPEPITGVNNSTFEVTVDELNAALDADGTLSEAACEELCRARVDGQVDEFYSCELSPDTSGTADIPSYGPTGDTGATVNTTIDCTFEGTINMSCPGGRDHAVIASASHGADRDSVRAWLQATCHAEAASVKAFVTLAGEVEAFGAPAELTARCLNAARDEVAHARAIGALATQRGVTVYPPQFAALPDRALVDLAIENAVEGCVREAYAAAVAHWQALHGADPAIRAAMAPIARDEACHGDLARDLHAWAMTQLTDVEQERVLQARREAVNELLAELECDVNPKLVEEVGLPDRVEAMALVRGMAEVLWSESLAA